MPRCKIAHHSETPLSEGGMGMTYPGIRLPGPIQTKVSVWTGFPHAPVTRALPSK